MGNDMMEAYLFETNTLLEQLDDIVLNAEKAGTFSQDDVNEIFRIMHTIKGSSAMMEFNGLMTVAHRIEDLFFLIRDKSMEAIPQDLRPELFDLIFQSIDFFRAEVEKLENNEPLTDDVDNFLQNINRFSDKIKGENAEKQEAAAEEKKPADAAAESAAPAAADAPAADAAAPAEGGEHSYGSAEFPFALHVFFDEGSGMENLRALMLVNSVKDFCEENQFDYYPTDLKMNPETATFVSEQGFFLRFRTAAEREQAIPSVKEFGSVRTYQTFDYVPPVEEKKEAPAAESAPAASAATASAAPAAESAPAASAAPAASSSSAQGGTAAANKQHPQAAAAAIKESLISVNLSKLDQLMAIVGEIVITESMVTASPDLKGLKLDNFNQAARQLRTLTDQLQDVSMSLRMVPVSSTFQKMKRIVRDMGKKLNKQANLVLVGEETEVDKTIVDSVSDPIMHIVRNSMDHGIEETVEERIAAGKDPVGQIILSASHTGSEVIIEIQDDGQGVNDEKVLNKAIRQGLAAPGMEYSHKDILNFLLMPGFSTNTEVTEFSGRGVGMDVVKSNVESVGGVVNIVSEQGKGMTTTLKIPLTMAIMDGMEVSVGGSIFSIPINNIRQIFKISEKDIIHDAVQGEMIKLMDNFYSIVRMKEFFRLEKGVDSFDDGILLWVESGEHSYCLFVDELIGEQQVVVKPLPSFVNDYGIKNYGISGCTVLGDGNISIILDVANIYTATQA